MRILQFIIAAAIGGVAAPVVAAPILPGNATVVTVAWGPSIAAAGLTAGLLGTATIDTSGLLPVISFPITGGFTNPDGTERIEHNGSGLSLSTNVTSIAVQNLAFDTSANIVFANASENGTPLAAVPVPAFDIGLGQRLTLSPESAFAIDSAFNTTAFSISTVFGTATTNPIVGPTAVPEPPTMALLGFGVLGILGLRRHVRLCCTYQRESAVAPAPAVL